MSGLARLAHESGWRVTGSDDHDGAVLDELATAGISVCVGPAPDDWLGADLVTASPAVPVSHLDIERARAYGNFYVRGVALNEVASGYDLVSIAGTHGKTTATSMAAWIVAGAQRDGSWLCGAAVPGLGPNAHGSSSPLVMETDESYGTFTHINPRDVIVLNVEADHLDHYGTESALHDAFGDLVARATQRVIVVNGGSTAYRITSTRHPVISVGRGDEDYRIEEEVFVGTSSRFTLRGPHGSVELSLAVPGRHNVDNAAAVATWALETGYRPTDVADALAQFRGAPRRFTAVGRRGRTHIIDDYAHLPGEVSATVAAARAGGYERIGVIFQPHRVTRTQHLAPSFSGAFRGVEKLVVTDIYRSGEAPVDGVDGRLIVTAVGSDVPQLSYVPDLHDAQQVAEGWFDELDLIIVMGAGDVSSIATAWSAS
jgi:UDP-N-acetylmuramate--alanine ligase